MNLKKAFLSVLILCTAVFSVFGQSYPDPFKLHRKAIDKYNAVLEITNYIEKQKYELTLHWDENDGRGTMVQADTATDRNSLERYISNYKSIISRLSYASSLLSDAYHYNLDARENSFYADNEEKLEDSISELSGRIYVEQCSIPDLRTFFQDQIEMKTDLISRLYPSEEEAARRREAAIQMLDEKQKRLENRVASYLEEHPFTSDSYPTPDYNVPAWDTVIEDIRNDGSFGREIELYHPRLNYKFYQKITDETIKYRLFIFNEDGFACYYETITSAPSSRLAYGEGYFEFNSKPLYDYLYPDSKTETKYRNFTSINYNNGLIRFSVEEFDEDSLNTAFFNPKLTAEEQQELYVEAHSILYRYYRSY